MIKADGRKIIIIGNGFDLSLGFRTSYDDYIRNSNFRRNLDLPLFLFIQNKRNVDNWIDLEICLKLYAQQYVEKEERLSNKQQYKMLCNSLKYYIKNIDYEKFDKESRAYEFIKNKAEEKIIVINFNYTDTVREALGDDLYFKNVEEIHVHGTFDKNIILGVEDNADIPEDFIYLKKSTHDEYDNLRIYDLLKESNDISFWGYSLGISDHSYFKDYFIKSAQDIRDDNNITFYHYEEEGKDNIYKELDKLTYYNIGGLKRNNNINFIDVSK